MTTLRRDNRLARTHSAPARTSRASLDASIGHAHCFDPSLPAVSDDPEDALITRVAIVGAAIALTPFLLLHVVYFFWPELFSTPITPN
ncbi:hypothetical protein Pla175_21970 [Pirellulimonas nuda]|uniref:Uncharacterized protein n=1 Tax=Pirellulimonas nuda TaxID=2528009 RepID=A0A518DBH5_9BACT|nr:hypothetical protein [Pirellulimonas nuda]QDU88813.1 hypothetical protein Pla175_21970 [Pirellulimonas nuda]